MAEVEDTFNCPFCRKVLSKSLAIGKYRRYCNEYGQGPVLDIAGNVIRPRVEKKMPQPERNIGL